MHTKKPSYFVIGFLIVTLVLCASALIYGALYYHIFHPSENIFTEPEELETSAGISSKIIVIDAGHGGRDSGAVGANGAYEKDLNLELSFLLKEFFTLGGYDVIMTREEDVLLYEEDQPGTKKMQDLKNRKKIAEKSGDAVFISIHMNTYPGQRCEGLQVWYSPNHPASAEIAESVQTLTKETMQPDNHRKIKKAGSAIYLLDQLEIPAVLIECGFISTESEAARLSDPDYRRTLSAVIFSAVDSALNQSA